MNLADRIHEFIDDERAPGLVRKYYAGRYTGSRFDTSPELSSQDPLVHSS